MILNHYEPDDFGTGPFITVKSSNLLSGREMLVAESPGSCLTQNEHTSWVYPSQRPQMQTVELSTIDQVVVRCWSSYVLCFSQPDDLSNKQIFEYLTDGLQKTIDQFPFITGRLIPKKNEKAGSLEIAIDPNSAVQFGYRDISTSEIDLTFEKLKQYDFAPELIESAELQIAPSPDSITEAPHNPVFLAQATFIRGGIILFFAHSHQIADVTGTNSFMRTWSENTSAAAAGRAPCVSETLRDASLTNDRRRLSDGDTVDPSVSPNCFPMVIEDTPSPSPRASLEGKSPNLAQNPSLIWHMDRAQLQQLKELASPEGEAYISTLDAVNALFWRAICRSRQLSEKSVPNTRMYFVCDVRRKLDPPLRPDSACNATMKLYAAQACENIQGEDLVTSLKQAAFSIRQAINEFSPSRFETWVSYVKSAPSYWSLKPKEQLQNGPDIVVTDHSKVSAYHYVWGPLGRIERIRNPWWARSAPKPFSQVTLMPRLPDNGLEILTNLDTAISDRLLADEDLGQFATIRCS